MSDSHEVKFNEEYPVLVIATGKSSGEDYAKAIGLQNYKIVTSVEKAQGLRCRAIVVTPGYLNAAQMAYYEALKVYDVAIQNLIVSTSGVWG